MRPIVPFLSLTLIGCQGNPAYMEGFDPDARSVSGTIVHKEALHDPQLDMEKTRDAESRRQDYITQRALRLNAGAVGTIMAIVVMDRLGFDGPAVSVKGEPVVYLVKTPQVLYKVISYHIGFSPGDCVKLFISSDGQKYPPRMAYGSDCQVLADDQRP